MGSRAGLGAEEAAATAAPTCTIFFVPRSQLPSTLPREGASVSTTSSVNELSPPACSLAWACDPPQ